MVIKLRRQGYAFRPVGEVRHLVRVALQIEELRAVHLRVANELPAAIGVSALHILVGEQQLRAGGLRGVAERGAEVASFAALRRGHAAKFAERGKDIEEVAHGLGALVRRNAGAGDDERHTQRMLIHVLLANEAVTAARDTAVGREHNDRVLGIRRGLQRVQHAANQRVEIRDVTIVFGDLSAHLLRGA